MIELPKKVQPPLKEVPSTMIIFGLPKSGKTTAFAELPNALNLDVERGSDFVSMMRLQPPDNLGPVGTVMWFKEAVKAIKDAGNPYDFVVIETVSKLDELSEWVGTWNYMQTIQGKNFNREAKGGKMIDPDSPEYDSVHSLADGNGYRYSRAVMNELFDLTRGLGKICTIYSCHVTDKYIVSKLTNTEVRAIDLALTGKVKHLYSREVDAIGYVWNIGGQLQVSFKGSEEKLGGMRGASHIQGYEGPLDWKLIFKLK